MAESQYKLTLYIEAVNKADATIKQFVGQVQNMGNKVDAVGNQTKASLSDMSSVAGAFKSGLESELSKIPAAFSGIGAAAVGAVAGVLSFKAIMDSLSITLRESLLEFSEDKLALDQLAVAWKNAGRNMPVAELNKPIADLAKATWFSDTAIANAARQLSIHGAITDDLIDRSLKAAANLAAFKGMDIGSAAEILGRAAEGQLFGLRRMGIALSAATMESKNFRDVLKDIESSLGGQAVVAATSYHGQLKKIQILHGELKERIGSVFAPAAQVFAGQEIGWLTALNDELQKSVESGYLGEVAKKLENIAHAFTIGKPAAEGWADSIARAIGEALKTSMPLLTKYIQLLEWIGAQKKEQAEESGGEEVPRRSLAQESVLETAFRNQAYLSAAGRGDRYDLVESLFGTEAAQELDAVNTELERFALFMAKVHEELNWTAPEGSALEQYVATLQRANEQLSGQKGPIDWKLEEVKAQAYFASLTAEMKSAYEQEKAEIESTAQTKEEAERRKFDVANTFSQKRIATALAEYERMLATKQGGWSEQEKQARFAAVQQYAEKIRALEDELFKVQQTNADGLLRLRQGTMSEGEKLSTQLDQMRERFQKAVELMPTMPERAKALFQEAQQLASALTQNIKSLQDKLADLKNSFADSFRNLQKLGETPQKQWEIDLQKLGETGRAAWQALDTGEFEKAQKLALQAKEQIENLMKSGEELYGAQKMKDMFGPQLAAMQAVAQTAAEEQLKNAKEAQEAAEDTFASAGERIEQIITQQIDTLKQQISVEERLIQALENLKAAMGVTSGGGAAGQGAQAGMPGEAGAGQPGTAGPYGNLPEGVPPSQAWLMESGQGGGIGAGLSAKVPAGQEIETGALNWFDIISGFMKTGPDKVAEQRASIMSWLEQYQPDFVRAGDLWKENVSGLVGTARSQLMGGENVGADGEGLSEAGEKFDGSISKLGESVGEFINGVQAYVAEARKPIEVKVTINAKGEATATWS